VSWWMWIVLAVLVVFGWYLSSTAGRLDRLHRRVDAGRVSLDRALVERGSISSEVGAALLPDPASAVVISDAALAARRAGVDDELERSLAESNLTQVLAAAFDVPEAVAECASVPGGRELLADLDSATRRVQLSRRFLNDAVRACRDLRYQWTVRVFRLAGRTPWPQSFEMDDAAPLGFGVR
jgi:hypothetical protein